METREELHRLIGLLPEAGAEDALEYLRCLTSDEDTLPPEELAAVERAEAQMKDGHYITLADVARSLLLEETDPK